jgi:hypothetical protein
MNTLNYQTSKKQTNRMILKDTLPVEKSWVNTLQQKQPNQHSHSVPLLQFLLNCGFMTSMLKTPC